MIKAISFKGTELSNEFVMYEIVSLIFVFMGENKDDLNVWYQAAERGQEDTMDLVPDGIWNILTKKDSRLMEIWGLTRIVAKSV